MPSTRNQSIVNGRGRPINTRSTRSEPKSSMRVRSYSDDGESQKIYQPPALQMGYHGRDLNSAAQFAPFSPGSKSAIGKWEASPAAPSSPARRKSLRQEREQQRAHSKSFDYESDRSASYYRGIEEERRDCSQRTRSQPAHIHADEERSPGSENGDYYHHDDEVSPQSQAGDYFSPVGSPTSCTNNDAYASPNQASVNMSPGRQRKLHHWYQNRFPVMSKSESTMGSTIMSGYTEDGTLAEDTRNEGHAFTYSEFNDYMETKQSVSVCSIALTSVQLLILMCQLTLCGVAPLDVNPMVGPFPDAYSEWGGKNAYLMLVNNEWWRMITPSFLHVGVLHLAANAFCQLETVAMFEREWGSFRWVLIYIISALGASAFSNLFDEDTIAVTSSGAVMGMYAAKLAEVTTVSFFDTNRADDDIIRLDQLSSVLCGLVLVSLLGSFTFIDWSANMGGLLTGFLSGLIIFADSITSCCTRFCWITICFGALVASFGLVSYQFFETAEPDDQLGDLCEYFKHLYPEGVECGCFA